MKIIATANKKNFTEGTTSAYFRHCMQPFLPPRHTANSVQFSSVQFRE